MVLLPLALHEPAEQLRAKYGDVMTTREVADHLRISEFTVRRIADSELPRTRHKGRAGFRYAVEHVAEYKRKITEGACTVAPQRVAGEMPRTFCIPESVEPIQVSVFERCVSLYLADSGGERGMVAVLEHLGRSAQGPLSSAAYSRLTALNFVINEQRQEVAELGLVSGRDGRVAIERGLIAAAAVCPLLQDKAGSVRFEFAFLVKVARAMQGGEVGELGVCVPGGREEVVGHA